MPATGKVYIFNTTNQSIRLELNDTEMDYKLPPRGGQDVGYIPTNSIEEGGQSSFITLPRSDASSTSDAVFAATNTLELKFSGTSNVYKPVAIDPASYSTDTDLVLYIFNKYVVIASPTNNAIVFQSAPTS
jgi:hypothetical protein